MMTRLVAQVTELAGRSGEVHERESDEGARSNMETSKDEGGTGV